MSARSTATLSFPPKAVQLLQRAGYEALRDVSRSNVDDLVTDLNVSHDTALSIIRRTAKNNPVSHSLASLLASPSLVTGCAPLDRLLGDNVHLLNVIGPPGAGRERVAISTIRYQLIRDANAQILVLDCQGHLSPAVLCRFFPSATDSDRIQVVQTSTILALELFVSQLPRYLSLNPTIKLVVLASIIGPPTLRPQTRAVLTRTLAHLQAQRLVAVLITTQVQTHFPDGGTFDTSRRPAVLRPQLRDWLPGSAHEVMLVQNGRSSGYAVVRKSGTSFCTGAMEGYLVDQRGCLVSCSKNHDA